MNSKVEIRLEAARIAAQLMPTSGKELIKDAKKIAAYIEGKADLPEVITEDELIKTALSNTDSDEGLLDIYKRLDKSVNDFVKQHQAAANPCTGQCPWSCHGVVYNSTIDAKKQPPDAVNDKPCDKPLSEIMMEVTREIPTIKNPAPCVPPPIFFHRSPAECEY